MPVRPRPSDGEPARVLLPDGQHIEFRLLRSARRRRTIEISIDREGVLVRAPLHTPMHEVDALVRERADWIARHRGQAGERPQTARFTSDEPLTFLGRAYPLLVTERPGRARVMLDFFNLRVFVSPRIVGERREQAIHNALMAWYRERAAEILPARVERWAPVIGRSPSRVLVRDQRRRWGSCAPDGTLRFNWRLMLGPPPLVDYVVVHELAHLWEPNHGARFWRIVASILPDYRERRRHLREFGRALPL